jgi:hypothetical protein
VIVAVGNPKDFATPLTSLGLPVTNLDITIPGPKPTRAQGPTQPKGLALLAKMAQAMGGESNLTAIRDLTQKAELNAGAFKVSQTESWVATGHYRAENSLPFGKVVSYSDGKTGWEATPKGVTPIPDPSRKQIGFELFRMWSPLLASADDPNREIKDEANGAVRISDKAGNSVLLSIDPATGLPLSENYSEVGSPSQDVIENYSDWQETNGVKLPRRITITRNGRHFADIKIINIAINQGLTPEQLAAKPLASKP